MQQIPLRRKKAGRRGRNSNNTLPKTFLTTAESWTEGRKGVKKKREKATATPLPEREREREKGDAHKKNSL